MRPAILTILFAISAGASAQSLKAETDFENSRSLLIHELPFTQSVSDTDFVTLREGKRGEFDLIRYDLNLNEVWKRRVEYQPQLNVPQLLLNEKEALLASYTVRTSDKTAYLDLKRIDLGSGEVLLDQGKTLAGFTSQSPYPKLSFSNDLSKIVVANYVSPESEKPEMKIYAASDLSLIKSCPLDAAIFGAYKYNRFAVDNGGGVFCVSINARLFRMDGYYIPAGKEEPILLQHDMFFLRPMETVGSVLVEPADDAPYFTVAASGKIGDELIGVKLAGFDFRNYDVPLDTAFNYSMAYLHHLYKEGIKTSGFVKKSTLGAPYNLEGFDLQSMKINSRKQVILMLEKNMNGTDYHETFNNSNLVFTYNTKGKLQKSEDIIIQSFSPAGDLQWDHVLQKYQVTKPHKYFLSYVPGLHNDTLSILSWTKKRRHSFQACQIDTRTGEVIKHGADLMKNGKFTYHKNYSTWVGNSHVVITTQKNNRMGARKMHVVRLD